MKFCLLFLFSVSLLAQSSMYQDSISLSNGKTYACFIKNVDNHNVTLRYLNDNQLDASLKNIAFIYIDRVGVIFTEDNGYAKPVKDIQDFLNARNVLIEETSVLAKKLMSSSNIPEELPSIGSHQIKTLEDIVQFDSTLLTNSDCKSEKRWSFGVTWFPNVEFDEFRYFNKGNFDDGDVYHRYTAAAPRMEGDFSYTVSPEFSVIGTIAVTSRTDNNRLSSTMKFSDNPPLYYTDLNNYELSIHTFDFELGCRYTVLHGKSSPHNLGLTLCIGKQLAKSHFDDNTSGTIEIGTAEMEKVIRELHSPFHLRLGLVHEYFFNESLSLNLKLNFRYRSVTSDYTAGSNTGATYIFNSYSLKFAKLSTDFGIGLSAHF